jgi:hypothetical protein
MATIKAFVDGKDAALLEQLARSICHREGSGSGNCYGGNVCKTRNHCSFDSWPRFVDEAELVLKVIREKNSIVPKSKTRKRKK